MVDLHLFKKNSLVKFRQNQQHKSKSKIKSKKRKKVIAQRMKDQGVIVE